MDGRNRRKVVHTVVLVFACMVFYWLVSGGSVVANSSGEQSAPSGVGIATDLFLYVDGVPGESIDDVHKDWIEIVSLNTVVSNSATSSQSAQGVHSGNRPQFSEFVVGKVIDKATPKLHLYCCTGKHIPNVYVELCRASGQKQTYMRYHLQDVIISSVGPNSVDRREQLELVSFRFGSIKWEYTTTDRMGKPGGTVQEGWNLVQNRGI